MSSVATGAYAVTVTYSFDTDAATYLFDEVEAAQKFLKEAYEAELALDKESGYNSYGTFNPAYAKIENYYSSSPDERGPDVTEFHLSSVYCTNEQEEAVQEASNADNPEILYLEVEMVDSGNENAGSTFICIKAARKPSFAEAEEFLREDLAIFGCDKVVDVAGLTEYEARSFYDMSDSESFPIFGA